MNIGQIIYNLQDFIMSSSYISTNKNNINSIIKSTDESYATMKVDIVNTNLVLFYGANKFTKLGVQAPPRTKMKINNKLIIVGSSGIYELDDCEITSLSFLQPTNQDDLYNIIIDFLYE